MDICWTGRRAACLTLRTALTALTALLVACGGGGGGDDPATLLAQPTSPSLPATPVEPAVTPTQPTEPPTPAAPAGTGEAPPTPPDTISPPAPVEPSPPPAETAAPPPLTPAAPPPATVPAVEPAPAERALTLAWVAPTTNDNGTALVDLAGYRIYYGDRPGVYTASVTLGDPHVLNHRLAPLAAGTYYIVVKAVNHAGIESASSTEVAKTLQ